MTSPPRWIIGGTHEFLSWRETQKLRIHLSKQNTPVIPPEDAGGFGDPDSVVWVRDAHKRKDIDKILQLDHPVVLLWGGRKPEAPWLAGIPQKNQSWHDEVPAWDQETVAVEFLRRECRRFSCEISVEDALALVSTLGTDLAVLSWEVDKVCRLVGTPRPITLADLKQTIAGGSRKPLRDLIDVLPSHNPVLIHKTLRKVGGERPGSGEVMQVVRGCCTTVQDWVAVAVAIEDKRQPDAVAEILGQNPFRFRKFTTPAAQSLGVRGALGLLAVLAKAEDAVLTGQRDPWTLLVTLLLQWCDSVKRA